MGGTTNWPIAGSHAIWFSTVPFFPWSLALAIFGGRHDGGQQGPPVGVGQETGHVHQGIAASVFLRLRRKLRPGDGKTSIDTESTLWPANPTLVWLHAGGRSSRRVCTCDSSLTNLLWLWFCGPGQWSLGISTRASFLRGIRPGHHLYATLPSKNQENGKAMLEVVLA